MDWREDREPGQGKPGRTGPPNVPLLHAFGEHWVLYFPAEDSLLILNSLGKAVWEMWSEGCGRHDMVSAFSEHFGLSSERAWHDVGEILATLECVSSANDKLQESAATLPAAGGVEDSLGNAPPARFDDCGVFRFGHRRVRVMSAVAEAGASLFRRFAHRALVDEGSADTLEISGSDSLFRLTFRGHLIDEVTTINSLLSRLVQLLLGLEHPATNLLAHCHAGAVIRNGRSLLIPGSSGTGKSTLTAFLVANGFAYLGDDIVAIAEGGALLLPLPTCMSIKSGSWPVLEKLYPVLAELPSFNRGARTVRYIEPKGNYETLDEGSAPSIVLFPIYQPGEQTRLSLLPPLESMLRLVGAHASLAATSNRGKTRAAHPFRRTDTGL